MKRKILSLMLAAALTLGLAVPAMAYTTPDFSDVPSNHWAYQSVMKMADAGVIKGTGNGQFSPEMKLSAEMFVVLVGRVVFPDVKAEGTDWSGPYVTEAKAKGLLEGTNITDSNLKGEISRYDMAVILAKCVELLKVSATKADSSKVTDYGEVPTKYVDAVLMAYGSGLIRGDQAGNFNGANSMTRQEAATVMDRLLGLIPGGTTTEPDPEKPTNPDQGPLVDYDIAVYLQQTEHAMSAPAYDKHTYLPGVSAKLYYTPDGGETSTLVGEGVSLSESRWNEEENRNEIVGYIAFRFKAPESWSKGANFYVSAETVYEGQKLVTGDLRTDGRAYKNLFSWKPGPSYTPGTIARFVDVEMTPPTGEKALFTYQGHILTGIIGDVNKMPLSNFTIQLHLADGRVVAETVSKEDGFFSMECAVDALDGGFDARSQLYYVTASGYYQDELYVKNGKYSNADEEALSLRSLVDLDVYANNGIQPEESPDDHIYIYSNYRKDS